MTTKNISTVELQGLVPAELRTEIIKDVTEGSVMLQLANVKEMNQPTMQFPVELDKPGAYVVGEGQKITIISEREYTENDLKKIAENFENITQV